MLRILFFDCFFSLFFLFNALWSFAIAKPEMAKHWLVISRSSLFLSLFSMVDDALNIGSVNR